MSEQEELRAREVLDPLSEGELLDNVPERPIELGIADWADECAAKGLVCSFVMDSARAFSDVLRDVLASGRASFGMVNGKYGAVRDKAQTVPVQMFTPSNSWGFSY